MWCPTEFVKIHHINHGLDKCDVGRIFVFREGKFFPMTAHEGMSRGYGDWTLVSSVIDADNFEGFSGDICVLETLVYCAKNEEVNDADK